MSHSKTAAINLAASAHLGIEEVKTRREPTPEEYRYALDAYEVALDHGAKRAEIFAEIERQKQHA